MPKPVGGYLLQQELNSTWDYLPTTVGIIYNAEVRYWLPATAGIKRI